MVRPQSIITFERLYLGAWLLGLLNTILNWNRMLAAAQASVGPAGLGRDAAGTIMLASTLLGCVITLLLWYFAARRGSAVAKWIITVFFAIGLLSFLWGVAAGTTRIGVPVAVGAVALVLQGAAVVMLFRPDVRGWFGEAPAGPVA